MKTLEKVGRFISTINRVTGQVCSFLMYPLIFVVMFEVIARYVFRHPTMWAHDTSTMIFGAYIVLAGGYTLLYKGHVKVDILFRRLSIRAQAIVDLFTYLLVFFFCSMLLWKGIDMVELSWRISEVTITPARLPIYPIKAVLVVGAVLVLLQALSKYISDILTAITNRRVEL